MRDSYEVVVVGGGIAGSALACSAARAGRSVLLLESQSEYKDHVRGEFITPWGVRELVRLGLEAELVAAGGDYATLGILYDELLTPAEAEAAALDVSSVAPDVAGALCVGHPEAASALSQAAAQAGAEVVREVSGTKVVVGQDPAVWWTSGGEAREVGCRLVVGADGRSSTVRKQVGIGLAEDEPLVFGAGLLVRGDVGFRQKMSFGTVGQQYASAAPRHDLTRLYLFVDIARQSEFSGPGRLDSFLRCFPTESFPYSAALAAAEPAGPCGGSPMNCSWTTVAPAAQGVVLIGDAAGWNDPVIGQGLSVALRDARAVAEVLSGDDWSLGAFSGYISERADRMHRLRVAAQVATAMRCDFTQQGRERRGRWMEASAEDEVMTAQFACCFVGPEAFPGEAFTDAALERTLAI